MGTIKLGNTTFSGTSVVQNSGGASNPNIVIVTEEADLYNAANVGKILELQSTITLTANRTMALNAIIKDGGGKIVLGSYTLTGNNTGLIINGKKLLIDVGLTGVIAGTWDAPQILYANNFGAIPDGKDHKSHFIIDKTGTGSITSGSTTLVVSDANFDASRIGQKIVVMKASATGQENALITTIASVTNATTVVLANAATVTVTGVRVFYGTDNYNMLLQALTKVRNQKAGELIFTGHYMTNVIQRNPLSYVQQDGLLIGNGTNNIIIRGLNGTLQAFPIDFGVSTNKKSDMLMAYKTIDSEMIGMKLVGFFRSAIQLTEYPTCFTNGTGSYRFKITNCNISEAQGDGILSYGDVNFENYIKGDGTGASNVAVGKVSTVDGTIDAGQTNYIYSTTLLSLTTTNFQEVGAILGRRKFALTGSSYAGWSGLTLPTYNAYIYDSTDTFVTSIDNINFADEVIIQQDNWKKIRVEFKDVVDPTLINLQIRSDFNGRGLVITNTDVSYCGRQGASNFASDTTWNGGYIHNNGGIEPGYGIDIEDHRRSARNILLTNLTMWDNYGGDIALIGTENVIISNCLFKPPTRKNWGQNITAISASYARSLNVIGCNFEKKRVNLGRGSIMQSCYFNEGIIALSASGVKISDIQMIQGQIILDGINTALHNKLYQNSSLSNITIRMYKDFSYILSDRNCLGVWKDIEIVLNDSSIVSNLVDGSTLDAGLKSGQTLWAELDATTGQPYGTGSLENFTVKGNLINGVNNVTSTLARFPQYTYTKNVKTDTGVTIGFYGLGAVNLEWENLECKFLDLDPRHGGYLTSVPADPIANPAPIWTFKNLKILNKAGEYNMSTPNLSFRLIEIEDFWLDVVFENAKIINEEPYVQTLNRSMYLEMDNYGSVTFDNCIFGNKGSEGTTNGNNIVLTNTYFRNTAITYPVTFINPKLIDGQTIVPDTTRDKILFTQLQPEILDYAVFADETAATTAGYSSGYMYVTSTGETRVKL